MRTRSWDDIGSVTGRYWLLRHDVWEQVSQEEYVAAERTAGFSAPEGKVATAAFENTMLGFAGTTLEPCGSRHPMTREGCMARGEHERHRGRRGAVWPGSLPSAKRTGGSA